LFISDEPLEVVPIVAMCPKLSPARARQAGAVLAVEGLPQDTLCGRFGNWEVPSGA